MTPLNADMLTTLYEHAGVAVLAANLDREITALNPAAERLFGYREDELLGEQTKIIYADPRDFLRLGQTHFNAADNEDGSPRPYTARFRTKSGRVFDGETVGCPIIDSEGRRNGYLCIITDVTSKLALQAKLEASDIQLRAALASANEGAFSINLVTGLGSMRGFMNEFLGIESADATISIDRLMQSIHEDDRKAFETALDALRRSAHNTLDVSFRGRRNDGEWRWLHGRGRVTEFTRDGAPLRATGVIADITERQALEAKLAERERQFANAITAGACGVWEVNTETLRVTPLGEIREMLGVPPEPAEIDGRLWLDRTHADERKAVEEALRQLETGESQALDVTYRLLDARTDTWRWIRSRGRTTQSADQTKLASGVLIDITEEMGLKSRLEDSEERLRQAVEAGSHGVWDANFVTGEVKTMGQIRELLDLPEDVETLDWESWLSRVAAADRDRVRDELVALRSSASDQYESNYGMRRGNGELVWLTSRGEIVERDSEGEPVRAVGIVTDITERRILQRRVEESEARLRDALESAGEGAWRLNLRTRIADVTAVMSVMMGLPPADTRITYDDWAERVHPEDRAVTDKALGALADGSSDTVDFILRYNSAQDGWIYIHNRGRISERDEHGVPAIATGFMTDITEQLKTNDMLAQREQQLSEAMDGGALGIWRIDYAAQEVWLRGEIVRNAFADSRETTISAETWMSHIHPADTDRLQATHKAMSRGENAGESLEFRIRDRNGHWVWYRSTGNVMARDSEGRSLTATGALWNIDASRRAADQVSEERQRFADIYRDTPAMMHTIDADGRIVQVSDYWLTSMGYRRDQVIGRKSVEFLDTDSQKRARDISLPELFETGRNTNIPYRFIRQDGRPIDVLLSSFLERDDAGNPMRSYAVMTDVTPLRVAYEQLERSNRELDRFATVASHDLQEPLRKIGAFAGLVRRRYGETIDAEGIRALDFLVDAAHRMQTLIDDLLGYSRLASQPLQLQQTDLNAIVAEARESIDASIEESGAVVTIGDLPVLRADPVLLRQCLQNILANAVKYRGETQPRIDVSAAAGEGEYIIAIQDNGIGLDPKFADKIFAPFQRLHSREEYQGTGIGLAIVRQAVERHGGRVWVESELGHGSTFFIALPAQTQPSDHEFAA
ncbi:PAS domain-containing protein [Maricaulis sp.]|uniref:PAS domain-containing sensor histidine kinase n=1 Tax=Maricaulis sp. TaxID=1486257 RepID=UPI002604B708|nr:PAS domain-containing protein [Maricaulis sp.]